MKYYREDEQTKIENYDLAKADNFKGWIIHHRLELTIEGDIAHTANELERLNMYYNRPYYELIYLKKADHVRLHRKGKILPWKITKKPTLDYIIKNY